MTATITIERMAYLPEGTFGRMTLPSGQLLFTCEQPWNGNASGKSCIPEGDYELAMRASPVVQRSSGGEFTEGWEVQAVPGRSYIMLHPANWPFELKGCIAVGTSMGVISGKYGVRESRAAFRQLMAALAGGEWKLHIKPYRAE